jgi:hypothetical protein
MTSELNVTLQTIRGENSSAFSVLAQELLSTATRTSSLFSNLRCRGIIFKITTANEAGTASFTPKILAYDTAGNSFVLATFSAITTNTTTILCYYPAVLTGYSGTAALVGQLPRAWALELTYAGTPANDKIDTKVEALYLI